MQPPPPHLERIQPGQRLEVTVAKQNSAAELPDGVQPDSSCDWRVPEQECFHRPHGIPQATAVQQHDQAKVRGPQEEPQ
jgi:hypothetical protein